MKKVLLLMVAVLMISSVAMANHIGIYTDASGSSCVFAAGGFNPGVTVIEKFSLGSVAVRFKVNLGGNGFFGFNTPYTPVGAFDNDLSIGYGLCFTGSTVIGTAIMNLVPGTTMQVETAVGQTMIQYVGCDFGEYQATGGTAYVSPTTGSCNEVATEPSTWGQVKALYR